MNCFRINTFPKSWKWNYEGFMLGIAFIVKSFLNKIGSGKTDTGVLFVIFYRWKWNCKWKKKAFSFLLMREDLWQSGLEYQFFAKSIFVKCFYQFLIFRVFWLLPWFSKQVYLGFSFSFSMSAVVQNVCGWSVRYKTLLMVFK